MVGNLAQGVNPTSSGAGIDALVAHTGPISGTICV